MREEEPRDGYTTPDMTGVPDMTYGVPTPPLSCNDIFSFGVRSDVMLNNRTGLPMPQEETGSGKKLKGRREKNRTPHHIIQVNMWGMFKVLPAYREGYFRMYEYNSKVAIE